MYASLSRDPRCPECHCIDSRILTTMHVGADLPPDVYSQVRCSSCQTVFYIADCYIRPRGHYYARVVPWQNILGQFWAPHGSWGPG